MTKTDIQKILAHKPADADTAEWLAAAMAHVAAIGRGKYQLEKEREAFEQQMRVRARALDADCKHYLKTWQCDPAGGSDSGYYCLTCGQYPGK